MVCVGRDGMGATTKAQIILHIGTVSHSLVFVYDVFGPATLHIQTP